MKDLGVIFDRPSELNFAQHCKEKVNTAYSYLGTKMLFVLLYKNLVRSHLEYANSVWNPHRLVLIKRCVQLN